MTFLICIVLFSTAAHNLIEHETESSILVRNGSTGFVWECPEILELKNLPDNLIGYTADGCGYSGSSGTLLLPQSNLFLAVPPGIEPELEIIPEGVHFLSLGTVAEAGISSTGCDSFFAAGQESIPASWGSIAHTGVFRRAGIVHLELHPIVLRDGGLYAAERFRIVVRYPDTGSPSSVTGRSGSVFDALFEGGNNVWMLSESHDGSSPFWGLPWYALDIDTAGIYSITGAEIPSVTGSPSATLSMFCGRGREMGDNPWETVFTPRAVPILVEDGGDGIFDSDDRLFFFGRGLAWWECSGDSMPSHYNHRYSHLNTYWLTWGGEDGARMSIIDGELTGAPSMPADFLSRHHLEQNLVRTVDKGIEFADDWAWERSAGSTDTWLYFSFDAPEATGNGYLRLQLASSKYMTHHIRLTLNDSQICDTTWVNTEAFIFDVPCSDIRTSGNDLGIQIIRNLGSDIIYFDWFEVFAWTEPSLSGQAQVPIEWWQTLDRQKFTWHEDLSEAYVFLVSGDTLAARISVEDPYSFEFNVPSSWDARELWISNYEDMASPFSICEESPGRIIASMDGADRIYIAADEFYGDIMPLVCSGEQVLAVSASEVYNEFNGGVRDPRAIQAMVSYIVDEWDPIPLDLVLVGAGNWDPLNFVSTRISYIDILYRELSDIVSDDVFAIVGDFILPQIAVSRMCVINRSDLQVMVDRTVSYEMAESKGEWQTVVLGAADDERSPGHGGDEAYHTEGMERLLTNHLPDVLRPEKLYLILYDWNDVLKKPQAREDYIDIWSEGALVSLYLGHGGYDQLADEGLLYLEDIGQLACDRRLPVAFFGSCDVGRFQDPSSECIAQQVTVSKTGGAIIASGATAATSGSMNEVFLALVLDRMFTESDLSVGMCLMLGKIAAGYNINTAQYVLFGDGSIKLAYPWVSFGVNGDTLYSGEATTIHGSAPSNGMVLIESFESCQPDTYLTYREYKPIEYLSQAGIYFRGLADAGPDYSSEMFIPVDSDTGSFARTQLVFLSDNSIAAASTYPARLEYGNPVSDTTGPEIELWIEGCRNVNTPSVSGEITVHALLSDESGINLLGNTGRQLALYVDDTPQDVSEYFRYHQGSGTTGELKVDIGTLESGNHRIQLRATDGLLNTSSVQIDFTVTSDNAFSIDNVFPYPNPCSDGVSINWTQTSPGAVGISIFTISGRRIFYYGNIDGTAGYNQYWWNCNDADGDAVASGSYIFLVSASSITARGESCEVVGIIAVVRDSQ